MFSYRMLVTLMLIALVRKSVGHGRLVEPPARASMWRYGYDTPINYSDNELSCGGYFALWRKHKGKCGVCGDEWDARRENEAGGRYASGIITRHYYPGEVILVKAEITAFHSGWMEFRLCENNDINRPATEACFQKHLLAFTEGRGTRYHFKPHEGKGMYTFRLKLPHEVSCSQCILRWRYHTGNSWGVGKDGRGCMGCGEQEEFFGCSDISISYRVPTPSYKNGYDVISVIHQEQLNPPRTHEDWYSDEDDYQYMTMPPSTYPPPTSTIPETTTSKCHAVGMWRGKTSFDIWCTDNCESGYCPPSFCRCKRNS